MEREVAITTREFMLEHLHRELDNDGPWQELRREYGLGEVEDWMLTVDELMQCEVNSFASTCWQIEKLVKIMTKTNKIDQRSALAILQAVAEDKEHNPGY